MFTQAFFVMFFLILTSPIILEDVMKSSFKSRENEARQFLRLKACRENLGSFFFTGLGNFEGRLKERGDHIISVCCVYSPRF